jgi:hypothetical protein
MPLLSTPSIPGTSDDGGLWRAAQRLYRLIQRLALKLLSLGLSLRWFIVCLWRAPVRFPLTLLQRTWRMSARGCLDGLFGFVAQCFQVRTVAVHSHGLQCFTFFTQLQVSQCSNRSDTATTCVVSHSTSPAPGSAPDTP